MLRLALAAVLALRASSAAAQSQYGAEALGQLVQHLGVSARVLMIGAHPDDEDTQLIAWLARGRGVETAYLSLTRGEGGQNIIGSELGDALGIVRTEELLAARRIDGAQQFFTRAFDFGFSKTAEETFIRWPREDLLRQVVTIIRLFKPHVIVSVFSGTPRDGHGHHQVAGIIAREAYDVAADSARIPLTATYGLAPWTPLKFYRGNFSNTEAATLRLNVGEFAPLLGVSYAELAAVSRSQHRSQAFGALPRRGVRWFEVQLEHTRASTVAAGNDATETTLFDGVDTTWSRFRSVLPNPQHATLIDSLGVHFRTVKAHLDLREPHLLLPSLGTVARTLDRLRDAAFNAFTSRGFVQTMSDAQRDFTAALEIARERTSRAMQLATGIAIEATVPRELFATAERVPVSIAVYNRGRDTVRILERRWDLGGLQREVPAAGVPNAAPIAPDSVRADSVPLTLSYVTVPWWMAGGRGAAMYEARGVPGAEASRDVAATLVYTFEVDSARFRVRAPVVYRYADQVKGEVNRPLAMAPSVTIRMAASIEYARANTPLNRIVLVTISSSLGAPQTVKVALQTPRGLVADSAVREVQLVGAGSTETIPFRVRGRLTTGIHQLSAVATVGHQEFRAGYILVDYDHIRPRRMYIAPQTMLQAVDVNVPPGLNVAYVPGVADYGAAALEQLGIRVTTIAPMELRTADLRRFTTLVLGPRAYDASPELRASRDIVLDFARAGGTVVAQYGQYEMLQPGMMPYPIQLTRPADRVTDETAAVRFMQPVHRILRTPNAITQDDFANWMQERGLYMPRTFDQRYAAPLDMNDPGEAPNRGALLIAPVGRGMYVYTTLSLFRQLPNGVPGAARLFVNLVSAKPPGRATAR
ncbi:MAG TPA: PIG-L family deacetylase [Gemmatimonadaceae bacterium]|nr:PIG-L family deacetylase [Gemmatimonadaceae bacterium]